MSYYLPREIISKILAKVSAEDLIRFKEVSKLWYSIIYESHPLLHLCFISVPANCNIYRDDHLVEEEKEAHQVIKNDTEIKLPCSAQLVDSCRELLLLQSTKPECSDQLYSFNLNTCVITSLNCPPPPHEMSAWALVYDSYIEKYKVFGIGGSNKPLVFTLGSETDTLKQDDWRELVKPMSSGQILSHVFANGKLHYLEGRFIYSIDIIKEYVLQRNRVPWCECDMLSTVKGSLCLMNSSINQNRNLKVWVMETKVATSANGFPIDYQQWEQKYSITMSYCPPRLKRLGPNWFRSSFFASRYHDCRRSAIGYHKSSCCEAILKILHQHEQYSNIRSSLIQQHC